MLQKKTKMLTIHAPLRTFGRLILVLSILASCQTPTNLLQPERQDLPMITKTILSGQQVKIAPLVEGTMSLYYRMIPISQANLYTPFFPDNEPAEVVQYFIGKGELVRIDEWNYERIIKRVMKDTPELTKQLGRQGFRFENLKQMVAFYNQEKLATLAE